MVICRGCKDVSCQKCHCTGFPGCIHPQGTSCPKVRYARRLFCNRCSTQQRLHKAKSNKMKIKIDNSQLPNLNFSRNFMNSKVPILPNSMLVLQAMIDNQKKLFFEQYVQAHIYYLMNQMNTNRHLRSPQTNIDQTINVNTSFQSNQNISDPLHISTIPQVVPTYNTQEVGTPNSIFNITKQFGNEPDDTCSYITSSLNNLPSPVSNIIQPATEMIQLSDVSANLDRKDLIDKSDVQNHVIGSQNDGNITSTRNETTNTSYNQQEYINNLYFIQNYMSNIFYNQQLCRANNLENINNNMNTPSYPCYIQSSPDHNSYSISPNSVFPSNGSVFSKYEKPSEDISCIDNRREMVTKEFAPLILQTADDL